MLELKNDTYTFSEGLPPRKERMNKVTGKHKRNLEINSVKSEENSKVEVNSRIAKRSQSKEKTKGYLLINSVCVSFFFVILLVFSMSLKM